MKPEIITATIAAIVSIISATISLYGQSRTARLEDQLAQRREAESREAKIAALMGKYRDPLLRGALDLQSRLYNIIERKFLKKFYQRSTADKEYALQSTLYVVAEYLGWVEIIRREVQFLDVGNIERNRRLSELLETITQIFLEDRLNPVFRIYRGQQRAIGELMLVPRQHSTNDVIYECMGYAQFVKKLGEPEFAYWFAKLQDDIQLLATEPQVHEERLLRLQHALIDLLDFLDAEKIRIPPSRRDKVRSTT